MIAKKGGMPLENHGCGAIIIARGGRRENSVAAFHSKIPTCFFLFDPVGVTGGGDSRRRRPLQEDRAEEPSPPAAKSVRPPPPLPCTALEEEISAI